MASTTAVRPAPPPGSRLRLPRSSRQTSRIISPGRQPLLESQRQNLTGTLNTSHVPQASQPPLWRRVPTPATHLGSNPLAPMAPTQLSPVACRTCVLHRRQLHRTFSPSFLSQNNEPRVETESPEAGTLTPSDRCASDEEPSPAPGLLPPPALPPLLPHLPVTREWSHASEPLLVRSCAAASPLAPSPIRKLVKTKVQDLRDDHN